MAKAAVLDRADADLALGHTHRAIQRLSSLVRLHPTDLDLRGRLARAYQAAGNRIEAGRWGYLHQDVDTDLHRAFERAYPQPRHRLARLRWPAAGHLPASRYARERLAALGHPGRTATPVPAARRSTVARSRGAGRVPARIGWSAPWLGRRPYGHPGRVPAPVHVTIALLAVLAVAVLGLAVLGGYTVLGWIVH